MHAVSAVLRKRARMGGSAADPQNPSPPGSAAKLLESSLLA
jgi:hypothetical protein